MKDIWTPEYRVEHADVTQLVSDGEDWPVVWAEKWETNGIGERRFIERREYRIADHKSAEVVRPCRWSRISEMSFAFCEEHGDYHRTFGTPPTVCPTAARLLDKEGATDE